MQRLLNEAERAVLDLREARRILDVGAGLGQMTRTLARAAGPGALVVGVERDPLQIAEAIRQAELDRRGRARGAAAGRGRTPAPAVRRVGDLRRGPRPLHPGARPGPPGGGEADGGRGTAGRPVLLIDDDHEALRLWPPAPPALQRRLGGVLAELYAPWVRSARGPSPPGPAARGGGARHPRDHGVLWRVRGQRHVRARGRQPAEHLRGKRAWPRRGRPPGGRGDGCGAPRARGLACPSRRDALVLPALCQRPTSRSDPTTGSRFKAWARSGLGPRSTPGPAPRARSHRDPRREGARGRGASLGGPPERPADREPRLVPERVEVAPEEHPGLVVVVAATTQLDVGDGGFASRRVGLHVVELQEAVLGAAAAVRPHEGAAAQVAQPDRALDLGRDVARSGRSVAAAAPTGRGFRVAANFFFATSSSSGGERPVEDGRFVSRGDGVPQQVLGQPQLLQGLGPDRDLQAVTLRGEGPDRRPGPSGRHDPGRGRR